MGSLHIVTVKVDSHQSLDMTLKCQAEILKIQEKYKTTKIRLTISKPGIQENGDTRVYAVITGTQSLGTSFAQVFTILVCVEDVRHWRPEGGKRGIKTRIAERQEKEDIALDQESTDVSSELGDD